MQGIAYVKIKKRYLLNTDTFRNDIIIFLESVDNAHEVFCT